ncbi:hypothetical protein ACFYMO_03850 [Streptomyces sp. NPDC007025]|uniref:hypothetical protein n=1 Tax=Streptomyces sp. NPDC007025 TaxID=3364771 RepID=UPI0036B32259
MPSYTPAPGDRVRVTRRDPTGRIKFVKTGTVAAPADSQAFRFHDDAGYRVHLTTDQALAEHMHGWTQITEPITR